MKYKIDVFDELKKHGFNQTRIQKENLLPRQTITNIRAGKSITKKKPNKSDPGYKGRAGLPPLPCIKRITYK